MSLASGLLLGYVVVVVGIGLLAWSNESDEEFVISSRKVGFLALTASIFATLVTESLVFFSVGLAARFGPIGATGAALGPSLALLVLSFGVGRSRAIAKRERFVSVSAYCESTWGPFAGRSAKLTIAALLLWIVILQINLNSSLIGSLLGWSKVWSTVVGVGVVAIYLSLGGYGAVVKTDMFQSLLLLSIIALPLFMEHHPSAAVFGAEAAPPLAAVLLCATSFALTIVRPELWQRIYSARSDDVAAGALRTAALLFLGFCGFVLYYAFAVTELMPGADPVTAFVGGYQRVLRPNAAVLFPVLLLAAMMSSLDSAAFLFSLELLSLRRAWAAAPRRWARVLMLASLVLAGLASLYVFETLTFAYKINGVVMLFTVPLLVSMRRDLDARLLVPALACGALVYIVQIAIGRIDADPSEAIFGGVTTGVVLAIGLALQSRGEASP